MSKATKKRPVESGSDNDSDSSVEEKKVAPTKKREHLETAAHVSIPKWTPALFHAAKAAERGAHAKDAQIIAANLANRALKEIRDDPACLEFSIDSSTDTPLPKKTLKMAVALLKDNNFLIPAVELSKDRREHRVHFNFSVCPEWSDAGESIRIGVMKSDDDEPESDDSEAESE